MNETEKVLTRHVALGGHDPSFEALRALVIDDVLEHSSSREWSLQGFGMLRTYLGRSLRLHVWDPRFRTPDVSDIHDHPWHFESTIIAGRMRNVRYHVVAQDDAARVPGATHDEHRIMCGPAPTEKDSRLLRSVRVVVTDERIYGEGESYAMRADELHASFPDPGTVTLCRRMPTGRDPDKALVYVTRGKPWVSAEPRRATSEEVEAIVKSALEKMKEKA